MNNQDDILLDHIWVLLESVKDEVNPELVDTCVFFIGHYGFDLECLPEKLWEAVREKIGKHEEDAYWDAESVMGLENH